MCVCVGGGISFQSSGLLSTGLVNVKGAVLDEKCWDVCLNVDQIRALTTAADANGPS